MWPPTFYLFFGNGLLMPFSVWLIFIGTIIQTTLHGANGLFGGYVDIPPTLAILLGLLIAITSLIALLGVYFRNYRALSVYGYMLIILIVVEFSVGISGFALKSHMFGLIVDTMRSAEIEYSQNHLVNQSWDFIQQKLECCAVYTHTEWFHYLGEPHLPDSCCLSKDLDCGRTAISNGNFQKTPCSDIIFKWAHENEVVAAVLLPFIIILQIFSVFSSKFYQRAIEQYAL